MLLNRIHTLVMIVALIFSIEVRAQSFKWSKLDSGVNTSIRGMSVLSEKSVWLSGSNGWVAYSADGESFNWQQLAHYKTIDFRDIEAFSDKEAIIMGVGSPAYILKTTDGGKNWRKVYENNAKDIFLDGISFFDERNGIAFGDPINGLMKILITKDGGETWQDITKTANIKLKDGEAAFAASGSSIQTDKKKVFIATGGLHARLFVSEDLGLTWRSEDVPIQKGKSSTGTFSIAVDKNQILAIGGDYLSDKSSDKNFTFSKNQREWSFANKPPLGYKSCIAKIKRNYFVATGTSGTDVSLDNGINWEHIDAKSLNVCQSDKKGKTIFLAGAKGVVYSLKINP